jgi:ABC-2 type transport system permease protein
VRRPAGCGIAPTGRGASLAAVPASYSLSRPALADRLRYQIRVLKVLASVQFKLKYVDSALGYLWSLAKPLAYFGVLWVVFGRFFDTGVGRFPLYLLIGVVLFTFIVDAVGIALPSIVERGPLLRRISFPPIVIPLSATVTAAMTFAINLLAVAVFVAASGVKPTLDWFLLVPLGIELYVFVLGLALVISTLFVRFHDVGPLWELAAQLLLFASPVMYPITILPEWAQRLEMLNPFVQVMQDARYIILGPQASLGTLPTSVALHIAPIAITAAVFIAGLVVHRHEAPSFAERV